MAEFTEVMRQAKRICAAHGGMCKIRNCPMVDGETCRFDADRDDVDYNEVERIIMAWAAEHPAQRYPSWHEAWQSLFPGADDPCPEQWFREDCPKDVECPQCVERPMSKKVAEKLGIKPIDKSCVTCKYRDKVCDEEPCVRCRNTQPEGSARWTEMSDLWEEAQNK